MSKRSDFQNENDSRLRLLYLYHILEQYTDAEHPLTTEQIRDLMMEKHGIYMHRTTVYYSFELLKASGIDLRCVRARSNQYYVVSRKFEIPEIRMLLDAVESSRFLTETQSKNLTDKLMTLTSETGADKLKRNLLVTGNVKAENRQVFYIIDAINEAINTGKRISFQYIDYTAAKKVTLRHKGTPYTVSPYSLVWNGDYYYMVGYYHEAEECRTFRVDRIYEQPEIMDEAVDPLPEDFDISRYTREVFRIYDTEEVVRVTLVCDNDIMKGMLDAFGMDIKVHWAEKGKFKTTVKVCPSPTFYAWVFQWQGKVRIARPEKVLEEYRDMAKRAMSI